MIKLIYTRRLGRIDVYSDCRRYFFFGLVRLSDAIEKSGTLKFSRYNKKFVFCPSLRILGLSQEHLEELVSEMAIINNGSKKHCLENH